MAVEQPVDARGECRFCGVFDAHAHDCPWLLQLIAQAEASEMLVLSLRDLTGALRAERDQLADEKRVHLRIIGEVSDKATTLQGDKAALELLVKELLAAAKARPCRHGRIGLCPEPECDGPDVAEDPD